MSRIISLVGVAIVIAGTITPNIALSQAHDADGHIPPNVAVDCPNLAPPPFTGLAELDQQTHV